MFVGHYGPGFVAKRPRDPIPLSGPEAGCHVGRGCVDDVRGWWAVQGSNLRPPACKAGALTN
jgi:hypothetical protein